LQQAGDYTAPNFNHFRDGTLLETEANSGQLFIASRRD